MKIRHLLLGLMICAAGIGTIDLSGGFLDDQNATQLTPFLIFGHVLYGEDAPCNNPIVDMTNLNTGAEWYADAVSGCNYYQTILCAANVSAGDVLKWSAADGAVWNATNHMVGLGDLESGGIFGFDMMLWSVAPRITEYAPESPVHDIENATRRFNITIDQVVDVTWLINSSPVQTNESVTDAAYTHTNVAIGVWNVSARASNENGTAMQEWVWNVTTLPPPANRSRMLEYSSSNTTEPVLFIVYGWVFYENRIGCTGAVVNITNHNTSMQWTAETHPGHYYYQLVLDAANVSVKDVLQIDASKDGGLINSTEHVITPGEFSDAAAIVDLNEGSIDLAVSEISPPGGFYADRNSTITAVVENDGTACTDGFEVAFSVDGALIETADVPSMGPGGNRSVNFNWMPKLEGNYTIVVMADSGRVIDETIESNNNRSVDVHVRFTDVDLVIIGDISLNKTPLDGDVVCVDAAIENQGNDPADNFSVVFYGHDAAFHTEILSLDTGGSDTVSACWDASYGEHDIEVIIDPDDRMLETDETNNQGSLGVFVDASRDFNITNVSFDLDGLPCSPSELEWGRTLTINATVGGENLANRDCSTRAQFYRNAYCWNPRQNIDEIELLFGTGNSTQYATVEWHIEDHYSIGDLYMTVVLDPEGEIHELDESNNEMVIPINVKTCDFTVIDDITVDPDFPTFGDIVEINATIENLGDASGSVEVEFMVNGTVNGTDVLGNSSVSLNPGDKKHAHIYWNTSKTNLAGNCTVTVEVDPDHEICETDETNNTMSTEIFVNGTDLDITEIGIPWKDFVYIGDVLDINATITNHGAINASEFVVEFYGNDSLFYRESVSNLESGGTHKIDAEWDFSNATSGTHILKVMIDACDNPENNFANNIELDNRVWITSPWKVTNVSFDPKKPDEGEDVTVTATVLNEGPDDRTVDVYFYVDGREFRIEPDVTIGAYSTEKISAVLKDVRALLLKPDTVKSNWDIKVEAGDSYFNEPLQIGLPNLTVFIDPPASSVYNETADVDIRVTNNGAETAKTTLWFYDVDNTYYDISRQCSESMVNRSYQGASGMSVRFDEARIFSASGCKGGKCIVHDKNGDVIYSIHRDTDGSTAVPDDWITWGSGDAIGITYKNMDGAFITAALQSSTLITIPANESVNLTIPWHPRLGEHTLWARVSSASNSTSVYTTTQDLAVTDLMVDRIIVDDGDVLNITATIDNIGCLNVTDFKVRFFNDSNEFCVRNISGSDMSGGSITVTAMWEVDTWNESDDKVTLNHTIEVEVDPCENLDGNVSNNIEATIVRVNPTRDFSVTDIMFVQDGETEQTTYGCAIKNFGRAGSTNVSICVNNSTETIRIYSGSHWIDSECYVNATWNASMAGNCTINVTADPNNRILETDESNNSMALPVYIEAPDLTVKSLLIDPFYLIEGNTTNITATIANIGDRDADNVTVAFCDRGNYIQYGDWKVDEYTNVTITQPDAAGIRVYLKEWHLPSGGRMYIYDGTGNLVIDMGNPWVGSNKWTEWIPGSSVRIVITKKHCFAEIDKYEYRKIFNRTNLSLDANTSIEIRTNWTAYPSGPHEITMIVDPDDVILELNKTNNELTNFTVVQGPDLSVDLILNNTNPVHGDIINITARIKNIGVLPANDFTVKIEIDKDEVYVSDLLSLPQNETLYISTTWETTLGDHVIRVTADPDETIFETGEENNAVSINVFVNAPDLDVTDVELNPVDPMDGDETWINATIANQGFQRANNFSVDIFYEYSEFEGTLEPYESYSAAGGNPWGETWVNLTWKNKTVDAGCIYIHIEDISKNPMLRVYDMNNTLVTNSTASRWIGVMGNATNISVHAGNWNSMKMRFYAGNVTRFGNLSLDINESVGLGMRQEVSTGRHNIRVFADTGNSVNETNRENNIRKKTIDVQPSRDFSVSHVSLSASGSEIGVNNTPLDGDPVIVSVTVENTGFRKGIVDVDIIDEHEWIDAVPRYELTPQGYAQVIGYPGADEVRLHFNELDVSPRGVVEIRNGYGTLLCTITDDMQTSPWVSGDEIYVYRVRKPTAYDVHGHIVCDIDRYQYRKINRSTVELAANGTANISTRFTQSAGGHTIRVITDPEDKIGEILESNNMVNETLHVEACRDPAVVDVKFSPEMPYPGDAVNVTATVTNYGTRAANFTVDLTAVKFEYWSSESPHESGLVKGFDEVIVTYPEADWTGVHFTRISTIDEVGGFRKTFLRIYDGGCNMSTCYYGFWGEDVWEWVRGDVIRVTLPELSEGSNIWGCKIDERVHIVTLNRTTISLRPGETANVTGILPNVRVGNRSISYTVTAVVDQDNIIFETDESNNTISRELIANCPDLSVSKNLHFTDGKACAVIRNIGTERAEDVEVRFSRDREFSGRDRGRYMKISVEEDDIDAIRVHFKELTIRNSVLRIKNCSTCEVLQEYTSGDYSDIWSDWVDGDYLRMYYVGGVDFEIDRYEYAKDESVGDISAGGTRRWEIPWAEYDEPYNLTIDIDPMDDVVESDESNNNETIEMGADIVVRYVIVDPYAPIMGDTGYIEEIRNIGNLPTGEFNVTISINATNETAFEYNTTINETISLAPDEEYVFPWETPEVEPPDDIDYNIRIVADPEDVVEELDEGNNEGSTDEPVTVYSHTNYTGGELYLYDTDWVYGGIEYTIGDSTYRGSTWNDYVVDFEDVIPENIKGKDIKLARLYLYWTWSKVYSINESRFVPVPIEVDVKFNDGWISEDRRYIDYPHATDFDVAWGTYTYKIPSGAVKPDNLVIVDRSPFKNKYESDPYYCYPQQFGIYGVGLLVVYESDDGVLTNYWINEGGDVIYEGANALDIEDMATTAVFEGKVEDEDMTNATLWTVTPGGNDENILYFNKMGWENVWSGAIGVDHRCVTEHLIARDNTARLQYVSGNSMMSSGAFLFLRYPPDLNIIDLTAPDSTVVGAHHPINTTIRNDGRSDARDFNVTLYIDGMNMVRIPHLDLPAGENMTLHLYNWTPILLGRMYNLTAAADILSGEDWTEVETDNNAMTKYVMIEEGGFGNQTGPRGIGGGSNPTGGEYTEKITGRVMQGMKDFLSFGGGGGAGMFSALEWLMKGAVWLVLMLFVCVGYFMEQRSYARVSGGLGSRI